MKKLGAGMLFVGALAVAGLLAILLWPRAGHQILPGDRVAELLKPYPWVIEPPGISSQVFSLIGSDSFRELRSAGEGFFSFDPERFVRAQEATSFRQAQLGYFARHRFDASAARFRRQAPHPAAWGPLPYPPLRALPKSWKKADLGPFASSFLASPEYQASLDTVTGTELTLNEDLKLYQNGEAFPMLERMASGAKKFAFLNVLSLTCDPATEKLIGLLAEKARAKVDVRIAIHRWFARLDRPCLKRLSAEGVAIVRAMTHASYFVTDQGEAAIGSESIARMFARSSGYNFLDRDMMLWVKGPLATDVLQDFISVWEDNRDDKEPGSLELVKLYKDRKSQEFASGLRGSSRYAGWLKTSSPRGLCRLAAQKPGGRGTSLSDLLVSLARSSRREIFASGVDIGDSPVLRAVREKARLGVPVDLMVNGYEGGNGELTMVLDEWIDGLLATEKRRSAGVLERVRDYDQRRVARKRYQDVREASGPGLQAWAHFGFLHYKAWAFDHHGVWVGSANPDERAHSKLYEAGALCLDGRLAREFAEIRAIDLANSVPYPSR